MVLDMCGFSEAILSCFNGRRSSMLQIKTANSGLDFKRQFKIVDWRILLPSCDTFVNKKAA